MPTFQETLFNRDADFDLTPAQVKISVYVLFFKCFNGNIDATSTCLHHMYVIPHTYNIIKTHYKNFAPF